jgi:hypothetical protein
VFSKFKSLNISLEEGRKALTFDLKGCLLHLANDSLKSGGAKDLFRVGKSTWYHPLFKGLI